MINPQLLEYVRVQRANGLSKEAIIQALGAGGWTAADVNEAFMAIDGVQKAPPPPAPPPQTPSQPSHLQNPPRTIIPPPGTTPATPTPVGNVAPVSAPRPTVAPAEITTVRTKRGWGSIFLILLIVILLIIAGGVALAMFYPEALRPFINIDMFFPPVETYQEPLDMSAVETLPPIDESTTTSSSTPSLEEDASSTTSSTTSDN